VFVQRLVTGGLAFIQAFNHGDPDDPDNQELVQEIDVDHIQHFGFESFPAVDGATEGIKVDADGGEACIAERRVLPSGLAALVVNESRTYGEDGQSILHKTGGDIEAEPKAGKHVKLGNGATLAVVIQGDSVVQSAALQTWMSNVEGALNTLGQPIAPLVGSVIGAVQASTTKVKAE
jgi:hypothetical protein